MGFKHELSIAIITVTPFISVFMGVCVGGCCSKLTESVFEDGRLFQEAVLKDSILTHCKSMIW